MDPVSMGFPRQQILPQHSRLISSIRNAIMGAGRKNASGLMRSEGRYNILQSTGPLSPVLPLSANYKQCSFAFLAAIAVISASSAPRAGSTFEVPPLSLPGPFPVACSNVVQDFTRVGSGESASDYWEGIPRSSGGSRYVTDLLADPANTLSFAVTAPSDGSLFSSFAGRTIPYVLLVCYPTGSANPPPDYALPTGKALPHMQRGNEAPEFAEATARYPLLLFSHGYGGSPLSNDYIDPIMVVGSFCYV